MSNQCSLRLATYNIWNNDVQDRREKHILEELHKTEAEVVGLQEVTDIFYVSVIKR